MKDINHFINSVAELREMDKLLERLILQDNIEAAILQSERSNNAGANIDKMLEEHYAERREGKGCR